MVTFCHRIIIAALFYGCIFAYLPYEPTLSNYPNLYRIDVPGWPSLGVIDLREGLEETIIAGTGAGLGKIINISLLGSIEDNIYVIRNDNLPLGANPAMKTYDDGNLIVVSGVTGTVEEPEGTGISWSLDGGESWQHIAQPIDIDDGDGYITKYWYDIAFEQLAITTAIKNVSYDVDVDLEYEYVYATSWAGMLQRFKYTDSNPIWEFVPLPMDGQNNLSCDFSCVANGDTQNCCDFTLNQNPNQNCDNNPTDYYANPVDGSGFDNHKAFSVYIDENYIWVGTAYGINRGEIISKNCIEWVHYTKENTNTSLAANWVIGFHKQLLSSDSSRLWAITWEANSSTPHKLSYSDDNGDTWNNDNGLQQGIGAVTYSLNAREDVLYASTSKGLFEINPFSYGCMDGAADNYNPSATINGNCEYNLDNPIINGCDLNIDYFYMVNTDSTAYQILYNSSHDIQGFNFDIIGADIESVIPNDGDASDFLFFNWDENNPNIPDSLGGNFDASTFEALSEGCGHLLTLILSNPPIGLSNISINGEHCYNYYTSGAECVEDAEWSKVEIPDWIFNQIGIIGEQDDNFKVYTSYIDVDNSNSLWIGTTEGIIVSDMLTNTFYYPYLKKAESLIIHPNPYLVDSHSNVTFELESVIDARLEIYDFSMTRVLSQNCDSNGERIICHWNGLNGNGQRVANGVYFCKIKVGDQIHWGKLGVIKFK